MQSPWAVSMKRDLQQDSSSPIAHPHWSANLIPRLTAKKNLRYQCISMVGITVKKALDCAQYDHKISSTCICRNSRSCSKSDAAVNALPLISLHLQSWSLGHPVQMPPAPVRTCSYQAATLPDATGSSFHASGAEPADGSRSLPKKHISSTGG